MKIRQLIRWAWLVMLTAAIVAGCAAPGAVPPPAPPPAAQPTSAPAATTAPEPTAVPPTSAPSAGTPKRGGVLRFASTDDFGKLDPATLTSVSGAALSSIVRDSLVKLDRNYQPAAALAETWSSPDGKTWTFKLRQGVKWHDGQPFTADDVIYTINRVLDEKTGSAGRTIFNVIDKMEAPDPTTLVITLKQPNLDFPYTFHSQQVKIIPKHQDPATLNTEVIGTGPFKVQEIVPGEKAVLVRNPDYYIKDQPYLDGVEILVMPDRQAQLAGLKAGQIDAAQEIGFDLYKQVKADPKLVAQTSLPLVQHVIYMDVTAPPFNDKRVRDAMRYIVDRQALLDAAYFGEGVVTCDSPVIPPNPNRKNDVGICKQDIAKAKELLKEAGQENLKMELWTLNDRPGFQEVALTFQQQAKEAGVEFELKTMPSKQFFAEQWLKVPIGVSNWGPRAAADTQFRLTYICGNANNETKFCNKDFEALLDQAVVESDPAKRKELYYKAQDILASEGGTIIPFFYPRLGSTRDIVKGYFAEPNNQYDFSEVWIDQ